MKPFSFGIALVALVSTSPVMAEEAFLQQVSVGGVGVSVSQPSGSSGAAVNLATHLVNDVSVELPAPTITRIDLRHSLLVPAATEVAYAQASSVGDRNTALVIQTGTGATSIQQYGNDNYATSMQNGSNHRAAVYQTGNANTAAISQSGSTNSALIVQN